MSEVVIAVVNFNSPTSAGLIDVTDAAQLNGLTPKGCIIFGSNYANSGAGADQVNAQPCIGVFDGIVQQATSYLALDNAAASDDGREWSEIRVINSINNVISASAVGFIKNGIRLNFINVAGGTACRFTAVFFAGRDVKARAGYALNATGNGGTTAVSTVGFTPDLVFHGTLFINSTDQTVDTNDSAIAYGWAHNGGAQMGVGWADDDNLAAGPAPSTYVHGTQTCPFVNPTLGTLGASVGIQNFNAAGFEFLTTLGTLGSLSASKQIYLALELGGAEIKVQTGTTKTSTGTQNYTGFGFDPEFVFALGVGATAVGGSSNRDTAAGAVFSVGAANATVQGSWGGSNNATADPSDTNQVHLNNALVILGNNTTPQEHVADLSAFITDGFTLNYSAAAAVAKQMVFLAIKTNASARTLPDAYVGVATFSQAAKGLVDIPIDLGGRVPKAIILLSNAHQPANDATETQGTVGAADFGIGFAVIGAAGNFRTVNDNNAGTQTNSRWYHTSLLITGTTFSQAWEIYLTGFGSDRVRLNFLNAPITSGHTRRFTIIVFAGEDVEAHLNLQNLGTGTSAIDVTAPDFEPDLVFAATSARTASATNGTGGLVGSIGVAINDGSDTQRAFGWVESAGTLTVSRPGAITRDDHILSRLTGATPAPTVVYNVLIGSFDSQGYSVTPSASASSEIAGFLAIKLPGMQFELDDFLTKATTGVEAYGATSFTPRAAFMLGGGNTSINTAQGETAPLAGRYIAAVTDQTDPTKVGVYGVRNQNAQDPTIAANKSLADGHVVMLGNAANFTDQALGEFDGFTATGIEIDFTATTGAFAFLSLLMAWDDDTAPPTPPFQVEQSGALIVTVLNAPLNTLQSGGLIVAQQESDGGVFQSGVLVVGNIISRPFNWVLPEEPIEEAWQWRTDIMTSDNGSEQRTSLRSSPTVELTHKFALDNKANIRKVNKAMWSELGKPVPMPHYQYKTKLQQPTLSGQSRIYFDPKKTNLRNGGYAYIQQGDTLQIVRVKTVFSDGARLYDTIGPVFTTAAYIMPLTYHFVSSGANMKRVAPDTWAEIQLTGLDTATISPMTNPEASIVTLPTCDGFPILDRRGVGSSHEQAAVTGAKRLDNGPGVNTSVDPWLHGDLQGSRTIRVSRMNGRSVSAPDVEWLRTFAEYCKGSCFPFLAPTWRNDFDLVAAPDGGTTITLEGEEYADEYFVHAGFRYIALETATALIVRRVDSVAVSGGNSVLTVSEALPNPVGSVTKVSLAPLSRIGDDKMSLVHYAWHTEVTIAIRTTDQ